MINPPSHQNVTQTTPCMLLELKNITRTFETGTQSVQILKGIDLTIHAGEFVAIMGKSGSGKTTLMNIIGGLDRPTSGSYKVLGKEISSFSADELATLRRETFGFIFQRYNLLTIETAVGNVQIPAIYAGKDRTQRTEKAKQLLEKLGLGHRLDYRPNQMSGGQQQRVAVARSLMNDPLLILADEPTGALDTQSGLDVMNLLHDLHRAGHTIVLITHDEAVAENAQRIIRMQDGYIVSEDIQAEFTPSSLVDKHAPSGEISFFGSTKEALMMAFKALRMNIYRTALTLLGIIIGVAAVVVMMAVGAGSKDDVIKQINSMGTNLMFVRPGAPGLRNSGDIATLTPEDAKALADIPNVVVSIAGRSGQGSVRYADKDYKTSLEGTDTAFSKAKDWDVAQGTFFSPSDVQRYAPVAVLGETVKNALFPYDDNPIGEFILIKNIPFEVIGILEKKGANSFGRDQDDAIFIPYTTGLVRIFGKNYLSDITVSLQDVDKADETQQKIEAVLLNRHNGVEDFQVRNLSSLVDMVSETQDSLTLLLGIVAAVSLFVGGIGVMNIMLVSVTERTREIGIRMATGARTRDILLQFNIESVVVCAIGGVMGVMIGIGIGMGIRMTGVSIIFSVWPAGLAFTSSCATGIIFGYLPARKAARLDPVVALSSE